MLFSIFNFFLNSDSSLSDEHLAPQAIYILITLKVPKAFNYTNQDSPLMI